MLTPEIIDNKLWEIAETDRNYRRDSRGIMHTYLPSQVCGFKPLAYIKEGLTRNGREYTIYVIIYGERKRIVVIAGAIPAKKLEKMAGSPVFKGLVSYSNLEDLTEDELERLTNNFENIKEEIEATNGDISYFLKWLSKESIFREE